MRPILIRAACLGLCVASPLAWSADNKPQNRRNANDEQRENQAVKEAQEDVREAEKALQEAEQDVRKKLDAWRKAGAARKMAISNLQKVQDRLEIEHAESTGLAAARKALKAAQVELQQQSRPILERLAETPDYQAARKALDKAKAAVKPPDDEDADPAARKEAAAKYAAAAAGLRELERRALTQEAGMQSLLDTVDQREQSVQSALKKFEKAVERDKELRAARKSLDQAEAEEDRAGDAVTTARRDFTAAKTKLAQAQQKLQLKRAQDAADKNRNNKGNKGK